MSKSLLVKVGKFKMNRHCRAAKSHHPSEAKQCPYCRVCPHGCTEYMHCRECHKDESWRHRPLTARELDRAITYLESGGKLGSVVRYPKNLMRFGGEPTPLRQLIVAELRRLVQEERKRTRK